MRFEERELKDYAEPVAASDLRAGQVYFSVQFLDEDMLVPVVEPFVFLGKDLRPGDSNRLYFQTFESHSEGVRLDSANEEQYTHFQSAVEGEINHLFEYERALDVLMNCALRRRRI